MSLKLYNKPKKHHKTKWGKMEVDDSQLAGMGLHPKRGDLDEFLTYSKWDRKLDLHTAVKAATGTSDKPKADEWFRYEKGTNDSNAVKCNVRIDIVKIQATVIAGNTNGSDKPLPDAHYLCKKQTGDWAIKHLVTSGGISKSTSHLRHAADPNSYSIKYTDYIPNDVVNAADKYITLYVD